MYTHQYFTVSLACIYTSTLSTYIPLESENYTSYQLFSEGHWGRKLIFPPHPQHTLAGRQQFFACRWDGKFLTFSILRLKKKEPSQNGMLCVYSKKKKKVNEFQMSKSQKWIIWRPDNSSSVTRSVETHWGLALARHKVSQLPLVDHQALSLSNGIPIRQMKNQILKPMASISSSLEAPALLMRQAVSREAATADGLSPMLFLLGQLSREDPGDSFGFLFREIGHRPGTIRPSVRDPLWHCSASALRREGTRH